MAIVQSGVTGNVGGEKGEVRGCGIGPCSCFRLEGAVDGGGESTVFVQWNVDVLNRAVIAIGSPKTVVVDADAKPLRIDHELGVVLAEERLVTLVSLAISRRIAPPPKKVSALAVLASAARGTAAPPLGPIASRPFARRGGLAGALLLLRLAQTPRDRAAALAQDERGRDVRARDDRQAQARLEAARAHARNKAKPNPYIGRHR